MKKILSLLLVAVLALSVFVACGETDSDTDSGIIKPGTSSVDGGLIQSTNTNTDTSENTSSDVDADELNIVGSWGCSMSLKEFSSSIGMDGETTVYMDFTADKKVSLYVKEDELFDALEVAVRSMMTKEVIAQQSNITVAQLEAALQQQGMTWETFLDQTVEAGINEMKNGDSRPVPPADAKGNIAIKEGNYKVENGKIYISDTDTFTEDQGAAYTYANGTLTVTNDGITLKLTKR